MNNLYKNLEGYLNFLLQWQMWVIYIKIKGLFSIIFHNGKHGYDASLEVYFHAFSIMVEVSFFRK